MNVTVILPIQILDISGAEKRPDRFPWPTIEPGEYILVARQNPFVPGVPFYTLPDTMVGGVKFFWHWLARQGRVSITSVEDAERIVTQESVYMALILASDNDCKPEDRAKIFAQLFPNVSPSSALLPHPELTKNFVAALVHHHLSEGKGGGWIIGLLPAVVAALCERNSDKPFAVMDVTIAKKGE